MRSSVAADVRSDEQSDQGLAVMKLERMRTETYYILTRVEAMPKRQ